MDFLTILNNINDFVWGPPLLALLVGTGIFLTIRLGLLQVIKLPRALKLIFTAENEGSGDINSFGALCTALAATVGTGNIVGVSTAIAGGGPGALFWMWVAAFFGMATKYAEGVLAIKYRTTDQNGEVSGGPMYYIERGMGKKFKPLAIFFAVSGVLVALLGVGTFPQVNAISQSIQSTVGVDPRITGIVIAVCVGLVIFGGIQSISKVSEKVVPFMAVIYIIFSVAILIFSADQIIPALGLVFKGAFTPSAAIGGFGGAMVAKAIQMGIARGVFSNESGLGSAPIAAAAAKTKWAAEQGLISMTGTFIDTIIICTLTGLSIIVTGAWHGGAKGAVITQQAFATILPTIGPLLLTICLTLFAFTTILGWCYYGERCLEYVAGVKAIQPYRVVFVVMVALGAYLKLEAIWILADIFNGLMALPNLIALLALSGVIVAETKAYMAYVANK
ncbi:alanine/glycine:cation symporter family protein [Cellulosilyticum sp. I15G10I2]|uniref:alanine/glycine:cation symporter family protein n=1 Tax=Cellulosilyticum sp. I15G10I2 TaxID=1892843 RepID=UPI00085C2579|nr:sodium:alanine symporter family protein [Cellulosilyticum sp. I15G10I2]